MREKPEGVSALAEDMTEVTLQTAAYDAPDGLDQPLISRE